MGVCFCRLARLPITVCILATTLWAVPTSSRAQADTTSARGADGAASRGELVLAAAASPSLDLGQLAEAARTAPGGDTRRSQPLLPEEPSVGRTIASIAAALLLLGLVAAGITLTVAGLRDDRRRRKRSYRRRSRRIDARSYADSVVSLR